MEGQGGVWRSGVRRMEWGGSGSLMGRVWAAHDSLSMSS